MAGWRGEKEEIGGGSNNNFGPCSKITVCDDG